MQASTSTAPVISNGQPSGKLASNVNSTTLRVTTDEKATCKYDTIANTSYILMSETFSETGDTSHSTVVTGLESGKAYTFYIRCQDEYGNFNTSDYKISFSINPAVIDKTAPSLGQVAGVPTPSNNLTPVYVFSSSEAGTITYGGICRSNVSTAIAGKNTITFNQLGDGTYSDCTINITDLAGNESKILTVNKFVIDTASPLISNNQPAGTLAASTTKMTLKVQTDEPATCKYSATAGIFYDYMLNKFSSTGGTSHATAISGLHNGDSYTYYVRCIDKSGNADDSDYSVWFSVASGASSENTGTNANSVNSSVNIAATTTALVKNLYQTIGTLAGADSNATELISNYEADLVVGNINFVSMDKAAADSYAKIVGKQSLKQSSKYQIAYFIQNGTVTTKSLGIGERAGVLSSYLSVYNKLPITVNDWQDVIKIANGRWPTKRNSSAEANAAGKYFVKIYRREPDTNNDNDNSAIAIITYGLRPVSRNLNSERAANKTFKAIYGSAPTKAIDWDIVRAIAYSGAKR